MDIKIHNNVKKCDLETIYLLEREYIIEHENNHLEKWEKAKEKTMNTLRNNISKIFVATIDNDIVGYSYWSIHNQKPCIFSIYVSKRYRNKGIASMLMENIQNQILEYKYDTVTLSTLVTNHAQFLFTKLGYEEIKRDNGWIDYIKNI